MRWSWRRYIVGGMAFAATIALASTMTATSVRADNQRSWNGMVMGGIIGGAIGSVIGKGSGRLAAIGAGTLLGSIYGRHRAEHHRQPRVYHRPAHRHHRWHEHRIRRHDWQAHHQRWKRPHTYASVASPPRPLVILHPPAERASENLAAANYLIAAPQSAAPRVYHSTLKKCRVLESGLAPAYACRGESGDWYILR